jgi:hypothetical protein
MLSYLMGVKIQHEIRDAEARHDVAIPGGCILCGGDLAVRFMADGAVSYCPRCNWLSHPRVRREDGNVYMMHPAGGAA